MASFKPYVAACDRPEPALASGGDRAAASDFAFVVANKVFTCGESVGSIPDDRLVAGGRDPLMNPGAIASLFEQTARAVYDERGPYVMHAGQWAVLRYLARAGRNARTVGGVAAYLGVTHAPASRAIAALARKNFVTVSSCQNDARVRRLDLTDDGRVLLGEDPVGRLSNAIEALPVTQQRELAKSLELIYSMLAGV